MNQTEYNAKVQELQDMWPDEASRMVPYYSDEKLTESRFQVYWDGQWHTLGWQNMPFRHTATYEWDDVLELRLRGEFAAALIHS